MSKIEELKIVQVLQIIDAELDLSKIRVIQSDGNEYVYTRAPDPLHTIAQEMAEALKPFAVIADKIKAQVNNDGWLEQPLFYAGDNSDPQKWTITGKGFDSASKALTNFQKYKEQEL